MRSMGHMKCGREGLASLLINFVSFEVAILRFQWNGGFAVSAIKVMTWSLSSRYFVYSFDFLGYHYYHTLL